MTFYAENIKHIKQTKHFLYSKMNEYPAADLEKQVQVGRVSTLDGDTALTITRSSEIFRMNSLYSPSHEAERWAMQFDTKNLGIIVSMFGMGNGVFARELLKKLNGQGALIIYEPSAEVFFYVLEHYDLRDILESTNVAITVEGINDIEIKNLLSNYVDWINLKSQIFCSHPYYERVFEESANNFYRIIQDNNDRTVANKNTDISLSRLLVKNTLLNLKLLSHCNLVTDLIGQFPEEVPAIIVAAGPSLDKNIEELRRAKGRAVIFAVDTAVKFLLAREIIPDFIVTLDPKKSVKHLADPRCTDIPIFARIDSRPANIKENSKKIILYNIEGYIQNLFECVGKDTGNLRSGGSVATGAFSICETIGFRRIILIGQDLAYQGESTHAGGITVDHSNGSSQIETVEDIYGNPIKTRFDWYVYIRWFEDAVSLFTGDEVIDATEGGAKINGSTVMPLHMAIDQYCNRLVDCDKIISDLQSTLSEKDRIHIVNRIRQDAKDMVEIGKKAIEACEICDKLIGKYTKSLNETTSSIQKNQKLSECNTFIESKAIYELIDWYISSELAEQISNIYLYSNDELRNKLSTYEQAKIIYLAIDNAVVKIQPMLDEGLSRLEEAL